MRKFGQDAPAIVPITQKSSYAERQFLHTFVAGVLLPLGQAFTTGLILFIATLTLAVIVFDMIDPFKSALTIGIVSMTFTYLYLQRRWLSLTSIEKVLNVDLNDDGRIGDEEPQTARIQLTEVKDNGHIHTDSIFTLPASPEKLAALAAGLLNNLPCSEKQWTGEGKPFSSREFRALKVEMVKRGLLAYVNPRAPLQGYALTKPGRAVMKHYIPSPTPQVETDESE